MKIFTGEPGYNLSKINLEKVHTICVNGSSQLAIKWWEVRANNIFLEGSLERI